MLYKNKSGKNDFDIEKAVVVKIPVWHELRKTFKDAGFESQWVQLSQAALSGDVDLYNKIAFVLTVYKDDKEKERELKAILPQEWHGLVESLLDVSFSQFHNLSLKFLGKILPYMEKGQRYDEACEQAGYHHNSVLTDGEKQKYLPSLYQRDQSGQLVFSEKMYDAMNGGIPNNPVVLRALNQARKVVNAIIKRYGSPTAIHIEMARDLSKTFS